MSFTVSNAIADNQQRSNTVGQRLADADFILFFNDAIDYFYTNLKLPTAQREMDLIVYPGVKEYALADDFIGVIAPKRPYELWSPNFEHTTEKSFVHWPYGNQTSIKYLGASKFLLVNGGEGSKLGVDSCEATTGWTAAGDASGLTLDTQMYSEGSGSLSFLVTPSTIPTMLFVLSRTLSQSIDISGIKNGCRLFMDLFCPTTNTVAISPVTVRLGSDASNYYLMTATVSHRGDSIKNGLCQVSFDISTASKVGTPVDTAINYIYVQGQDDGTAATGGVYHLDNIFIAQGTYYQLPYYSKNVVQDASGNWKRKITLTDDVVVCPDDLDLCINLKMLEIASAIRLKDQAMASYFARELKPKENYLKSKYPRMESRNQTSYYKKANSF